MYFSSSDELVIEGLFLASGYYRKHIFLWVIVSFFLCHLPSQKAIFSRIPGCESFNSSLFLSREEITILIWAVVTVYQYRQLVSFQFPI